MERIRDSFKAPPSARSPACFFPLSETHSLALTHTHSHFSTKAANAFFFSGREKKKEEINFLLIMMRRRRGEGGKRKGEEKKEMRKLKVEEEKTREQLM